MSSTRSDVNYHGKAARAVRPRERIDRGAKFTNAVQFPYNGAGEDNQTDSICARDTAKSCDELAAGDLIVIPRNESQLHRHQCGNGEAYRHSRLYQQKFYHPVRWEGIQTPHSVGNLDFHLHTG